MRHSRSGSSTGLSSDDDDETVIMDPLVNERVKEFLGVERELRSQDVRRRFVQIPVDSSGIVS